MSKLQESILVLVVLVLTSTVALGEEKCVNTQGEALIIKSDVPAAKMEAVARAKWAAIEQVVRWSARPLRPKVSCRILCSSKR